MLPLTIMPKSTPSDRTNRLLARNYAKLARELRQTTQKHESFKKMAFAAKKHYEKLRRQDAEILKMTCFNFSGPLCAQRKENKKLKQENAELMKEVRRLRENHHKYVVKLRNMAQDVIKRRSKDRSEPKTSGKYVIKGSMDI